MENSFLSLVTCMYISHEHKTYFYFLSVKWLTHEKTTMRGQLALISTVNNYSWNNRNFMKCKRAHPWWDSNPRPIDDMPSAQICSRQIILVKATNTILMIDCIWFSSLPEFRPWTDYIHINPLDVFCQFNLSLTQWDRGKMAAISQVAFSNAFSSRKIIVFRIKII